MPARGLGRGKTRARCSAVEWRSQTPNALAFLRKAQVSTDGNARKSRKTPWFPDFWRAAHVVPFLLCVEGRDVPAAPRVTFCHEQLQQNYSITSSARASSEGGTVRSSAFAVLRLIASSSLVACSTGRSLGLAPCSILSMYSATRTNPHRASWL